MQYRVTCQKADSDPSGHEVRIKLDVGSITGDTKLNDLGVKVSCSCPAFLYWGAQWHLHQKDTLEGTPRPLLQAPTQQLDKRNGYLICKHVKVVADRVIPAVSRVINNVARKVRVDEYKKQQEEEIRRKEQETLQVEQELQKPTEEFSIGDQTPASEWYGKDEPTHNSPLPYTPKPKPKPKKKNPPEMKQVKRPGVIK